MFYDGAVLTMCVGQQLQVCLIECGSAGFLWERIGNEDTSVLLAEMQPEEQKPSGAEMLIGGATSLRLCLRATGTGAVEWVHRRPFGNKAELGRLRVEVI